MIKANFIIVTGILVYSDGEYVIEYDFFPINPTTITFSGNNIISMKDPINEITLKEEPLYGRVVVAYEMDEIKSLYMILKNRTIFSIDSWSIDEVNKAILSYEVIKEFESLKIMRAFINL